MISTSWASPVSQRKTIRHWSLIRMRCFPARSPRSASKRFPGGARRSYVPRTGLRRGLLWASRRRVRLAGRSLLGATHFLDDPRALGVAGPQGLLVELVYAGLGDLVDEGPPLGEPQPGNAL